MSLCDCERKQLLQADLKTHKGGHGEKISEEVNAIAAFKEVSMNAAAMSIFT